MDNPKCVIHLMLYINNIGTKKLCEPQICLGRQLSNFKRSLIELNSLL